MKRLIMTVGLPRSGKSTWACVQGLPIVSPDAIRLVLTGQPFFAPAEPIVWAMARLMVASLFKAGHDDVILDATNTTRARREEWRSKDWTRVFQVFNTPEDECRNRAFATGREDLLEPIRRMADQFEPVSLDEEATT